MLTAFITSAIVAALAKEGLSVMAIAFMILGLIGLLIYASIGKQSEKITAN